MCIRDSVNSALKQAGLMCPTENFIGGLGGDDITAEQIQQAFEMLLGGKANVHFLGIEEGVC